MNKNDCKIVQDLLPNYIENLTSEETNSYIKEHLEKCEECKKIYENMRKNIKVNNTENNKKDVKYLKKYNNKIKRLIICMIFIIILVVIVSTVLVKKIRVNEIITNLEEKLYTLDTSNYSYVMRTKRKDDNYNYEAKYYTLNNNFSAEINTISSNIKIHLVAYKDKNNDIIIAKENDKVRYKINEKTNVNTDMEVIPTNPKWSCSDMYWRLLNKHRIKRISEVENKYYLIETKENSSFLAEKSTGIILKYIQKDGKGEIEEESSIEYTFGEVKESDLIKPDVSEYIN